MTAVGIVGPGRAGVGLGVALSGAGHRVVLHGRRSRVLPVQLELTWGERPPWLSAVEVIVLAVPDDALAGVATELGATGAVGDAHTVLHLSGVLDRGVLRALEPTGAALGSLHPLQSFGDPQEAPELLEGAVAAVEGDERAIGVATALAQSVGLRPVPVAGDCKAMYHAAAVFASNYLVVLASIAERLLADAGFARPDAREALAVLMSGTLRAVRRGGAAALTGPVARGDRETVQRHLAVLPGEARELYRVLARAALVIAQLPGDKRAALERVLDEPRR